MINGAIISQATAAVLIWYVDFLQGCDNSVVQSLATGKSNNNSRISWESIATLGTLLRVTLDKEKNVLILALYTAQSVQVTLHFSRGADIGDLWGHISHAATY